MFFSEREVGGFGCALAIFTAASPKFSSLEDISSSKTLLATLILILLGNKGMEMWVLPFLTKAWVPILLAFGVVVPVD